VNTTIADVENKMLESIRATGKFKLVDSVGRSAPPLAMNYPAAFVFFVGDEDTGNRPRPIYNTRFDVVVVNKNLRGEQQVARDTYELLEDVRESVVGKTYGLEALSPLEMVGRSMLEYENGVVSYALHFAARMYMPVPVNT
jgi:phage gp37-like protein